MHRTQIYLDDDLYALLEGEKKRTKQSISEIIRSTLKQQLKKDRQSMIKTMEKAAGAWQETGKSPEEYVRTIRKDRQL